MAKVNMMQMEARNICADAAPEMLEALKDARAWVRHWRRDKECNLTPTEVSLATAEATLNAAIAKAEGR